MGDVLFEYPGFPRNCRGVPQVSPQYAKQATCDHALTGSDRWACQRKAFGKPLTSQPVVRYKLANMIAKVEALQAWLETITFQMCNMVSGGRVHIHSKTNMICVRTTRSNPSILPGKPHLPMTVLLTQ